MRAEYWYLFVAGISFGLISFGAKVFSDLGFSLYEIAIFALSLGALSMLPFALKRRLKMSHIKFFSVYAVIEALTILSQVGSVVLGVPVAIAVFLLYMQPVYTILIGRMFLNETIDKGKIISVAVALLGIIVLVQPFEIGSNSIGLAVAVFSGFIFSLWVVYGRKGGIKKIHPAATNFWRSLFAVILLALLYPLISTIVTSPSIISFNQRSFDLWLYFIVYAIYVWGFTIFLSYKGLQKVSASDAGIILLLEPVSATLLAAAFLLQPLTINIAVGGFFILLANYLTIRKK